MKKTFLMGLLLALFVQGAMAQAEVKPRYKIRYTDNTKTYEIDGSVRRLGTFRDGRAVVAKKKGGYFVINAQGEKVFDLPSGEYPPYMRYDSGLLMVRKKQPKKNSYETDRYTLLFYDRDGQVVSKFENGVSDNTSLWGNVAIVKVKRSKVVWGITQDYEVPIYISGEGKVLSETLPTSENTSGEVNLYPLKLGRALVYDKEKQLWGYRDEKCQMVIPFKFRGAWSFTEDGLAVARNAEGKFGYINPQGEWVIEPKYAMVPEGFHSGRAIIYDKAKNPYFIDKTGTIVWKAPEEHFMHVIVRNFFDNGLGVYSDLDVNKTYIIDTSFKKLAQVRGFDERGNDGGKILATGKDWWQYNVGWSETSYIYDYQGNLLLEFWGRDNNNTFSEEGICGFLSDSGKNAYYFNTQGEVIASFKDSQF